MSNTITKTKTQSLTPVITYTETIRGRTTTFKDNYPGGTSTITYSRGPKYTGGSCTWKSCEQQKTASHPFCVAYSEIKGYRWDYGTQGTETAYVWTAPPVGSVPAGSWDSDVVLGVLDQLDMNISESSLIYSGVIQAIPLLGGIAKFNSVMRDVARHIKKGMRNQPFSTVMQSVISTDFINRFVIRPTLDDAHKFHRACEHVLDIINRVHERNAAPFRLESSSTNVTSDVSTSTSWRPAYSWSRFTGSLRRKAYVTSKAYLYLTAKYDTKAISPFKMWATRTGFTRPLDSMWDLVPFSFVADYFFRAGDFISALSDEMSREEGLVGKIGSIKSLWGSCKSVIDCTTTVERITRSGSGYYSNPQITDYIGQPATVQAYRYSRFPIANPGTFINMLSQNTDFVDVNLTPTRKRTLAELITLYKLRKRR